MNLVRTENDLESVALSRELNAAAMTHSRDMAVQNRPWHFGSDGSSPYDRARRSGYTGEVRGENISESFEDDLETLDAWLDDPRAKAILLDPKAKHIGVGWHQQKNGKIWWTLLTGA